MKGDFCRRKGIGWQLELRMWGEEKEDASSIAWKLAFESYLVH